MPRAERPQGARGLTPGGERAAEALLREGEMHLLGLMPNASNYTFLAEIRDGARRTLAIYKPRDGEAPLWDFPDGTLYRREVAAYEVSEALGWHLVPPTVVRDGPHGIGMAQLFVEFDPEQHYLTLAEEHADVFRRVAAFDVAINNADRKAGHCLIEPESRRIWLIDHGVSFHIEPKLRTVIWEHAGEPLPPDVRDALCRLADEARAGDLRERLRPLLRVAEIELVARRAERLAEAGAYPHPGPGRPYPWPPI